MSAIIIVSPLHKEPVPLVYNLGETSLIMTSDYGTPDAFELAAPVVGDAPVSPDEQPNRHSVILSHDETYYLYQCLTVLFGRASKKR